MEGGQEELGGDKDEPWASNTTSRWSAPRPWAQLLDCRILVLTWVIFTLQCLQTVICVSSQSLDFPERRITLYLFRLMTS